MFKKIADKTKPYSSYVSKFNAAESMLEIFEAIMYESGETCHGLVHHYQEWDNLFSHVLACFNDEELRQLAFHPVDADHYRRTSNRNCEDEGWLGRLQEFVEGAQDFSFVPGVDDAHQILYNAVFIDPIENESLKEDKGLEEDESWEEGKGFEEADIDGSVDADDGGRTIYRSYI